MQHIFSDRTFFRYMPLYTAFPSALLLSPPARALQPGYKYDALLFGAHSRKRQELCTKVSAELAGSGRRVRCALGSLWGPALRSAIEASRLVFGAHFFNGASLPVHRINQVLAAGTPMVHPPSSDAKLDAQYAEWGVVFVPQEHLAAKLDRLLRDTRNEELALARAQTRTFVEHVLRERNNPTSPLCQALARIGSNATYLR